ncbi:hypothetical protein MGYG_05261 [Nannizzia gypsea CBS 118893]|uniref:Uncharacterized protein n=1 Tax=Arthroderma gypseum (strain ATCC MYA-4604 / CBS 118893) TaxID=535722 RepID=E4UVD3_ARTGP|nr:hypothetical protein MGYG_05261 [Nannizzia gypsea CBS 118893]EFR02260.1 hypothetical protein MGYG_05261 [Nannizzia gypsea CBS 118893]
MDGWAREQREEKQRSRRRAGRVFMIMIFIPIVRPVRRFWAVRLGAPSSLSQSHQVPSAHLQPSEGYGYTYGPTAGRSAGFVINIVTAGAGV